MNAWTVVTYTRILAPDDDAAMEHARRVHGHSVDRITIKHGTVVLRDFNRHSGIERVATGRAARVVRSACGIPIDGGGIT